MADQKDRIAFLKDALKNLAKAIEDVSGGLINLEEVIKRIKGETTKLSENADKASKSMSKTAEQTKKATSELKKNETQTKKNTTANKGFLSNLGKNLKTIVSFYGAYQILNIATKAFAELTLGSIKQSIAFEKSLANLGAVAGATSEEVEQLGNNALSVAGKTKFTAEEIVNLQTELSKLGFSADDVVKSTESIAFAAQALGSDLAETASVVGKLRNQFNLLVEETTSISDILVTTINESALSFQSFGTAMQYVGPIANNLGLNLKQTAGAMAVLADAGFAASRIGTGLRGIFTELGKSSADVEKSLNSLAEQNISLSEAVDLVGKRNAAQLLTLLKNVDAIDDANDKYYQQGRALVSAAKQADTFSGQMEILNSEFQKFRIGIGDNIVKSNFFIRILGLLSTSAQRTAYGFKQLREIGFEGYGEDVKKIVEGQNSALVGAFRLLRQGDINQKQYFSLTKTITRASNAGADLAEITEIIGNASITAYGEGKDKLLAYLDVLKGGVATAKEQDAVTRGQTNVTNLYGKTLDDLIDLSLKGQNVNKEADILEKKISQSISIRNSILNSGNKISEERIIQLNSEISSLQKYLEQLTNVTLSEEQIEERRKAAADKTAKQQKKAVDDEIKRIKRTNKEAIDAVNERAKIETEIAVTAEERAGIEVERISLVSGLYKKQASEIRDLSDEYYTQKERIEEVAVASDKLSVILGSDVIEKLNKSVSDYGKELDALGDALDSGAADQETYDAGVALLRKRLVSTIATFKDLVGQTPELDMFFENLLLNFDTTSTRIKKTEKDVENAKDTFEDFWKSFKEGGWQEYAKKGFEELSDSLDEFNKTQLENTKATEQAKLDEILNRYRIEEQILQSQLNNQLITESQFRQKQSELKKAQIAEENTINKSIFDAEKKEDINNARIEGLEASAQAYLEAFKAYEPLTALGVGSIGAGIAIASASAQIAAINQRKYVPRKFAEGGVVNGPSHNQGGVPFSVQGQGGYEMEGGEYIINKRATSMHRNLLEKINKSGRTSPKVGNFKYAQGGMVNAPVNESVDYLKAIAEATTSTAIGVSKPVRSFITDKDLRSNSNERRIRDRNDRI